MSDATTELVPGRKYRIEFSDCCVEGDFTATFVRLDMDPPDWDGEPFVNAYVFDTARIGPRTGRFNWTEVE